MSFALSLLADEYAFSPPKELHLRNSRDFSLYADALALQAKEGGLEFAIEDASATQPYLHNGEVKGFSKKHSDYDFNPGLRIGMHFLFGDDRWNSDITWTFVKITNSKSVYSPSNGVLIPLWLIPEANSTNQTLHATWESNFNVLDFRLGKSFLISQSFIANPHFGGRLAFVDQHFSVNYGGYYGVTRGAVSHNDNDFAGLGLRGGVETEWKLSPSWALIGNLAGAILWGHFEVDQNLIQGVTEGYTVTHDLNQNIPNVEMALGVSWARSFRRDQFRLNARLTYEFHEWWDMLQLRRFYFGGPNYPNAAVTRNNFTMNGFAFRLQVAI